MTFLDSITSVLFPGKDAKNSKAGDKRGEELRRYVRVPQRMRGGFLWNDKLISARPCVIKDISLNGARIELLGDPVKAGLLADGVKLYFNTEKHEVQCSVRWSKGKALGLRFEGRPRPPSRTYK